MSYFTAQIDEEGKVQLPEDLQKKFSGEITVHIQTEEVAPQYELFPLKLQIPEEVQMTDAQFYTFCEIILDPPKYPDTSAREVSITTELVIWNRKHKKGSVYGSYTQFMLSDGGIHEAECFFIGNEKLAPVAKNDGWALAKLVPDFVLELMSESDRLSQSHEKMQKVWIKNGVKVAVMVDYKNERYFVYEAGKENHKEFPFSTPFIHEEVLPHFILNLEE
jgi:Uma2 family endonuclease